MSRLLRALALLALVASWMIPAQFAVASTIHQKPIITVHSEDESEDESEDHSEDQSDDQSGDHERTDDGAKQFAPPPLVVKHKPKSSGTTTGSVSGTTSVSGSNAVPLNQDFTGQDYVTSPVGPKTAPDGREIPKAQGVNPNQNEPLSNLMNFANYEDPAAEFMHKAYFGLAILATGAIAMAAHTLNKARKLAKANEADYDYEGQN